VGVNVAPIIPGLNDAELPEVMERAREAGASHAAYILLRLPGPVAGIFEHRLRAALPLRAEKVLARIREVRDTPVISMLETPVLPAVGEARESVQKAAMGGVFGAFVAIVLQLMAMGRASRDRATVEFFGLVDSLLLRVSRRSRVPGE
jgi:hypothetical protein